MYWQTQIYKVYKTTAVPKLMYEITTQMATKKHNNWIQTQDMTFLRSVKRGTKSNTKQNNMRRDTI